MSRYRTNPINDKPCPKCGENKLVMALTVNGEREYCMKCRYLEQRYAE